MSSFIKVALRSEASGSKTDGGAGFTDADTGEAFVPLGCNYFDPKTGWAPKIWSQYDHDRVARQLSQIGEAGLNCVRVFLDVKTLNPAEGEYSEEGFAKVDDMIACAKSAGIRFIFSGPNHWEGFAPHSAGDTYTDPEAMDKLCALWERIIERYAHEPAVMAWDLRNEPQVGWKPTPRHRHRHRRRELTPEEEQRREQWRQWRQKMMEQRKGRWADYAKRTLGIDVDDLPSSHVNGQSREVYRAYVEYAEGLSEKWVARQCETIRSAGAGQLISVGLIQWSVPIYLPDGRGYACFNPGKVAPHLDYMSVHFYPMLRNPAAGLEPEMNLQRAYLEAVARGAYVPGKPLVIEEFGWKGGKKVPNDDRAWPQEHQTLWCEKLMEITGRVASGWLNWGYADAASERADISAASGLWTSDEEMKHWGRRFTEIGAQFRAAPPAHEPAKRKIELDRADYLFDNGGHPNHDWLAERAAEDPGASIEVVFTD